MKKMEPHPNWFFDVPNMKTLILGTFPPEIGKRKYEFYYPNPQNHFWGLMAEIAGVRLVFFAGEEAVHERQAIMTKLAVGVENMGAKILREDNKSGDEDIEIIECHDIVQIIKTHPDLRTILLTGYSAKNSTYKTFLRHLADKEIAAPVKKKPKGGDSFTIFVGREIECIVGNSTSWAAKAQVSRDDLLVQFKRAILYNVTEQAS